MKEEKNPFPSLQLAGSPLLTAPQSIRHYFNELKENEKELPAIGHGFEPRPTPKHHCTRVLLQAQKYVHCSDCAKDKQIDEMIFCQGCFDSKLHHGHKFEEKTVGSSLCSCDCGRKLRLKQGSFCTVHSHKNIMLELKEEDATKFCQFFTPLFEILFYLDDQKQQKLKLALESVAKELTKLCEQSLYYVRLTSALLNKEVKSKEGQVKIKDKILEHPQFCPLICQMAGDRQFLLEFGEEYIEKQNEGKLVLFEFSQFRRELMDCQQFLKKMSKKGIYFPEEINSYFALASQAKEQDERNNLIVEYFSNVANRIDPSEYIDIVCNVIRQEETSVLNHEKFVRQILSKILSNFKPCPQPEQKQQEQIKLGNEDKLVARKCLSILNRVVEHRCHMDIAHYQRTLRQIYDQGLKENIQALIERVVRSDLLGELCTQKYRKILLMILLIVDDHPKKNDIVLKIWRGVMVEAKPFNENLDSIYELIAQLANSYRTFVSLGVSSQEFTNADEVRQLLFRSYLFENKQVSKKDLWSQFRQGWLKFKTCGKILNELCQFNNDHDTFVYKSTKTYPNSLLKVPSELSRNWENVRKMQITDQSPSMCKSEVLKKFFLILFKGQEFYNLFQQKFIKALQTIEKEPRTLEKWKSKGVGQNYIVILLLINKLCNGEQNVLIKEEIQRIKFNIDEYRFRFTEIGSEEKIKKMLSVDLMEEAKQEEKLVEEKEKKQQKTQQQIKNEQLAMKSSSKKQKLLQKLKQRQKNTLDKVKNEKSSVYEDEEENFCLSCKEREKKQNEFVNLLCLSKGNTISKILHADESKTSMKITTNLHTIHLSCFKEMKKRNMDFNCPLCKESVNCFLPYRPNRASESTLQTCWNVFNAVLVSCFNTYETGCLFEVLLDALVESLGFTELVTAKKSKNIIRHKNKSDLYLIEVLTCLFSFSNEVEKDKYRKIYKKMRENISSCTRKEIELFQLVILQAVFSRVTGQIDIDPTIAEKLSKHMVEEQMQILKNTLIFITEGNSEAISSLEDLSRSKLQERYEESPVKEITQEITSLQHIPIGQEKAPETNKIERVSLGINVRTPPRKLSHLVKKQFLMQINGSSKCACQSEDIESVCLICRRLFCEKCEEDKFHAQLHLGNYIIIGVKDARLVINKGPKSEKHDIYFNQFMIEYKKGQQEQESDKEDDELFLFKLKKKKGKGKENEEEFYRLNLNKFNELVSKFYNIV